MKLKEFFLINDSNSKNDQFTKEPKLNSVSTNSHNKRNVEKNKSKFTVNKNPKAYINQTDTVFISPQARQVRKPSITLIEWQAPERPFKKKSRDFYRRFAVIIIFFSILFLIIKDFVLILAMGAFFFVTYVFTQIPPRKVVHKITTNGINYASLQEFDWSELKDFFFLKKDDVNFLVFDTYDKFPGRLYLILTDDVNKKELQEIVNEHVSIIETPPETYLDKTTKFLSKKLKFS